MLLRVSEKSGDIQREREREGGRERDGEREQYFLLSFDLLRYLVRGSRRIDRENINNSTS